MIDFQNASFVKLKYWDLEQAAAELQAMLLPDETVHLAFKGMRDSVTFTSKRIVARNAQGLSGKKVDYTSLPYSRIQVFSVETAGSFDLDAELDLWFSGLGKVRLQFARDVDIGGVNRLIADHVL